MCMTYILNGGLYTSITGTPQCMTAKAIVLHGIQKLTRFPVLISLDRTVLSAVLSHIYIVFIVLVYQLFSMCWTFSDVLCPNCFGENSTDFLCQAFTT